MMNVRHAYTPDDKNHLYAARGFFLKIKIYF